MKPLKYTILLVFLMLAAVGCKKRGENQEVYVIGVAAPFSGQEGVAVYGQNIERSVELAIKEINARGGVRGKFLSAKYEDTQLIPSVAVTAVTKLATVNKCSVIIGAVGSSSTLACARIADKYKVILISPASTSNEISGVSPYVFRTIAPDVFEGEAMAEFAFKQGHEKIGVAFVDNAGTRGPAEVFRKWVENHNGEISAFEVISQGQTDVRSQMTKLISTRPKAVYLLGYALELGSMIKQYREQDKETPILSFQVMEEPTVREIAGDSAEGIIFTTPTVVEELAKGREGGFLDSFKREYGESPGIFSANAYDAVYVLALVIEEVGFNAQDIRNGLTQVRSFEGASGTFDLNEKGDSNQQPHFMIVRAGQLELYK